MKWASAVSDRADVASAVGEACAAVARQLGDEEPDLLVAFVSPHHADGYEAVPAGVAAAFPRALLLGCSARGVIGGGHEVEERAGVSLTAAVLPGVRLRALDFDSEPLPDVADTDGWQALVGVPPADDPQFVLLCDPFSIDVDALIAGLDAAYPAGRKVGGLASGGTPRGLPNVLYRGGTARRDGAVGVALTGDVVVDTIVAQGCRPIGVPMAITRGDGNLVEELAGKRPVDVLRALFESLDEGDRRLFRSSLFLGLEMNKSELTFHADFLVRNLAGVDPGSGALLVAAEVEPWQVVQFLLRDARAAEHDLVAQLDRYRATAARPEGALLFSCLGRGMHLFGRPDHDTDLFREKVGPVPLGGFFCNGEIGPVGGHTFLHGYTSAFGLFRHKS